MTDRLRGLLLELDVRTARSRFGGDEAFFRGRTEFAHFHPDGSLDLRLPREQQKLLAADPRLRLRPRPSAWVELLALAFAGDDAAGADLEFARELIQAAYRAAG